MYQYLPPQACDFQQNFDLSSASSFAGAQLKARRPARQIDFKLKYKTEICKGWEKGFCEYGEKCAFAHGPEELRAKTALFSYKAKKCKQFFETGCCMYGKKCQFLHHECATAASTPEAGPSRKGSHDYSSPRLPVFISLTARGEAEGWN